MEEVAELTEEKRETVRRKCKRGTYISTYKKVGRFKEYLIKRSSIKKYIKPKHRYHKIEFTHSQCPRINQDNLKFKDLNEQKIYNNAYDFQKKRIKKYITLFKLAGKLAGKELQEYLQKVSIENNQGYWLDDSLYVKRLQILPGRKLKVKSDNLNYDPFEVSLDTDNFHIVGKVIWAGALLECIK